MKHSDVKEAPALLDCITFSSYIVDIVDIVLETMPQIK